jgi:hypothetical protein
MQPTYMPWAGYFNLMSQVDCFVYLDDAQYQRSSWHNRNRILLKGTPNWLTVPVIRYNLEASIKEVSVDDSSPWRRKHLATLSNAYARIEYGSEMLEAVEPLHEANLTHLSNLNITLLDVFRRKLNITTPTVRSSELGIYGTRTRRLIDILSHLGATEYVTPIGALDYLKEDQFTEHCAVQLRMHDFQPAVYVQRHVNAFVSHLSILDVVGNLGWEGTQRYIRSLTNIPRII